MKLPDSVKAAAVESALTFVLDGWSLPSEFAHALTLQILNTVEDHPDMNSNTPEVPVRHNIFGDGVNH